MILTNVKILKFSPEIKTTFSLSETFSTSNESQLQKGPFCDFAITLVLLPRKNHFPVTNREESTSLKCAAFEASKGRRSLPSNSVSSAFIPAQPSFSILFFFSLLSLSLSYSVSLPRMSTAIIFHRCR